MNFRSFQDYSIDKIEQFFIDQWSSPEIVVSTGIYHIRNLDGFVCVNECGKITGLVSTQIHEDRKTIEIVSLDSLDEGKGIGTKLIQLVEQTARKKGCKGIELITTNDNLHAVRFYQKRGFRLVKVHLNAVEKARKYKPSIPLTGDNGIPIQDEWEFYKPLDE